MIEFSQEDFEHLFHLDETLDMENEFLLLENSRISHEKIKAIIGHDRFEEVKNRVEFYDCFFRFQVFNMNFPLRRPLLMNYQTFFPI